MTVRKDCASSPKSEGNDITPIEELFVEDIFEEIAHYLKYLDSKYFRSNRKEPREDGILRVFNNTTDEHLKNRLREAVYLCLEREELFQEGPAFIMSLLKLVHEMKVTQAKNLLLRLANMKKFPNIKPKDTKKLKKKIFFILKTFDIDEKDLKDIIDNNITDPHYTGLCLLASTLLRPKIGSFINNLPVALRVYRRHHKRVNLPSIFRVFLHNIGRDVWEEQGGGIVLSVETELKTVLGILSDANLNLKIIPYEDHEYAYVLQIKWPFDHRIPVSTILSGFSDFQYKILKEYMTENFEKIICEHEEPDISKHELEEDIVSPGEIIWKLE